MAKKVGDDIPNYNQILISCFVASEVIYQENPLEELRSDSFNKFNHLIKQAIDSKVNDDSQDSNSLQMKYMICKGEKTLIVAIRGSHSTEDFLVDLKLNGKLNNLEGRFHSGIFQRSQQIPIDYFIEKITEGYTVVFTGHSLGAAVAGLVTIRVLYDSRIESNENKYHKNILCIGFGSPAFADDNFKEYIERDYKNNFHFYVNEQDIVFSILTDLSNILYSETLDDSLKDFAKSFTNFISDSSDTLDFSLKSKILSLLNFAAGKILPVVLKGFVPWYKHFGITIRLKHNGSEIFEIEGSNKNSISKYLQSYLKKPEDFFSRIQHHFMAHYRRNFKKSIGSKCFINEALYVSELEEHFLPKEIEKRTNRNTCETDESGSRCKYNMRCNKYSVKIIKAEFGTEVMVSICCHNVDYIIRAILHLNSNEAYVGSIQKENFGAKTFTFLISNSKLTDEKHALKINNFKIDFVSHFMASQSYNIKFSANDLTVTETKFKEQKILNMQIDLLYFYAIFYCNTFRKMKSGEFNRECCELEEKLSELSKLWQSKLENDKYSEEELKGVFLSYFGEDIRIDNKTIMEQNIGFNQTFVTDLRQCVCENDIKILLKKALYTCYDLRVMLSLSKSIYKTWDKNTAWYLNMYNMTKNNIFIFFKKIFSKINPDEAYLLVLKSFPLYKYLTTRNLNHGLDVMKRKLSMP